MVDVVGRTQLVDDGACVTSFRAIRQEQAMHECTTAVDADLAKDVLEMVLHRVLGDAELSRDVSRGGATCHQGHEFPLAR